ncbi:hypothetical protein [Rubricoccus marinus]|uniref:hypothetical protein n=1 Tax=Rubricoccus marinus TaxID=716817 RepID=UPI00117B66BD|nr:hypothetical protein [Rubricoccus marinus]
MRTTPRVPPIVPSVEPISVHGLLVASRAPTVLDFDPARDGFSFTNSFVWTDADLGELARRLRPLSALALAASGAVGGRLLGRRASGVGAVAGGAAGAAGGGDVLVRGIAQRWRSFGLCGGMALAAAERWHARGSVPTASLTKDAMRSLLRRRQAETLRASLPRFVAAWARARLDGSAHPPLAEAMAREVEHAARKIESGRLVVLGLVGDAPDPTRNHQVVAFGVERGEASGEATFHVYDPNAPGQTRFIRTARLGSDPSRTDISTDIPTGPTARGFRISTRPNWLATILVVM